MLDMIGSYVFEQCSKSIDLAIAPSILVFQIRLTALDTAKQERCLAAFLLDYVAVRHSAQYECSCISSLLA